MADKVDEIIETLRMSDIESGEDPSYITREYVYKLLGQANQTAEEWLDDLMKARAYAESITYRTTEEEAMREMPAAELIRRHGPMNVKELDQWEKAGVFDRLKREQEAEAKQAQEQ